MKSQITRDLKIQVKIIAIFISAILPYFSSQAQKPLNIKFRSRGLLDASISGYDNNETKSYFSLEDFRIGFKASYRKDEIKVDIGIDESKLKIKDFIYNRHFKKSILSIGNMYEPFSMDMLISTADLRFHQSATSVQAFTNSRRFGTAYHIYDNSYYFATGVFTNNDINNLKSNTDGTFILTSRGIWRKQYKPYKSFLHLGGAFSLRSKLNNRKNPYCVEQESNGVTSLFDKPLLYTELTDTRYEFKAMAELLYTSERFMLQSEYFIKLTRRNNGVPNYISHGGYIQGSILLIGRGFDYDSQYAIPEGPKGSKSMELAIRANYTNMNHRKAEMYGGEETDLSIGINYYFNKYFGIKLNCNYVHSGKHCNDFYRKDFIIPQARVQYIF